MRYLILGASAAGINAAKTIRSLDRQGEIYIISEDTCVYSRCMLHMLISGCRDEEGIDFADIDFFNKFNIQWIKGKKVVDVDTDNKKVLLQGGEVLLYNKLLIATGASSFIPPIKGIKESKEVYGLRNIDDALAIREISDKVDSAVVIGAGLVGVDAVVGLLEKNIQLHLVEMANRILPMQLDERAALKYEEAFKKKGVLIYKSRSVKEILHDQQGNIEGVLLDDGEKLECGMVIVAAGVRPNIKFLKGNAIKCDKGIIINEKCETTAKDVYAAGDVTCIAPIWPVAVKQGIAAGYNMAGIGKVVDDSYGLKNSINFLGINTVSIGIVEPPDDSYTVQIRVGKGSYKKVIHKNGVIYGAIIQGDISYCGVLCEIIKNSIDISKIDKSVFDIDFSDFFGIKEDGLFEYRVV